MADKNPQLSIVVRTVDQATAKIKAINDRLDTITKPTRDFKKALSDLGEKSGLNNVVSGFKGVGTAVEGALAKLAVIGGVAGLAIHGLFGLVKEFDDLGDKAERLGVGVDWLAQMRNAAERAGAPVDALDNGVQAFSQSLGQARANTGRMAAFLEKVSPALLKQLKGAKSNEEAFDLLAKAMDKIEDPAKRAALAQKTLGDSALAPLLAKGSAGIKELREEYKKHAGSLEAAAAAAGATDDAMHVLHSSLDGVKGALVAGLSPALTTIIKQLTEWLDGHRADIAEWAQSIGEKLPGAVQELVKWLGAAYDKVAGFVDMIGGLKGVAVAAGIVIAGPLVASLASLAASLVTVLARLTAVGGAMDAATKKSSGLGSSLTAAGGPILGALAIAEGLNEATGGSIEGGPLGIVQRAIDAQHPKAAEKQPLFTPRGDISAQANDARSSGISMRDALMAIAAKSQTEAKLRVEFANAPKGMRVNSDPASGDVDFSTGYQMAGAM